MWKSRVKKPWRKEPLARPRYRSQFAIKVDITRVPTNGLVWLETGTSEGVILNMIMKFRVMFLEKF